MPGTAKPDRRRLAPMAGVSAKRSFDAILQSGHKQCAVEVPFDPATAWSRPAAALWPGRRGHRVHAVCNGVAFDSAIVARSRSFWLLIEDDMRTKAGWKKGDLLNVEVAPGADTTA